MKRRIFSILMTFALCITCATVNGQTFSKMPEKQRNAALVNAARAFYKNPKFKNFYKEFGEKGKPLIEEKNMVAPSYLKAKKGVKDIGKKQYIVTFIAKNQKASGKIPSAKVYISDELGKPWQILLADNSIVTIWDKYMKE